MYELYPFWYRFFTELKFEVFHSPYSTRKLYQRGQQTIPSDTVCFLQSLFTVTFRLLLIWVQKQFSTPAFPIILTSISEITITTVLLLLTIEVIKNNMKDIRKVHFIKEYFGIHRPNDFPKKAYERLSFHFPDLTLNEVRNAAKLAYQEQENYRKRLLTRATRLLPRLKKRAKDFCSCRQTISY